MKVLILKVDVVFVISIFLIIVVLGLIYFKYKKKFLVFEVCDLWLELLVVIGVIKNKFVIKFVSWLENYIYKNLK